MMEPGVWNWVVQGLGGAVGLVRFLVQERVKIPEAALGLLRRHYEELGRLITKTEEHTL